MNCVTPTTTNFLDYPSVLDATVVVTNFNLIDFLTNSVLTFILGQTVHYNEYYSIL